MKEKCQNAIFDFSGVYETIRDQLPEDFHFWNCRDLTGTDLYCTEEAIEKIMEKINASGYHGIHLIDSGNYHYMTKLFLDVLQEPFSLIFFDHHNDMQRSSLFDLLSCGSWAAETIRSQSYLQQILLVGPPQKNLDEIEEDLREKVVTISEEEILGSSQDELQNWFCMKYPVYISIDKDMLSTEDTETNWDQGKIRIGQLQKMLEYIFQSNQVLGVDICGECDAKEDICFAKQDAMQKNLKANLLLIEQIRPYLEVS